MTHATCRLTAKNRDQLRNPTLGNRVWDTYTSTFTIAFWVETIRIPCAEGCRPLGGANVASYAKNDSLSLLYVDKLQKFGSNKFAHRLRFVLGLIKLLREFGIFDRSVGVKLVLNYTTGSQQRIPPTPLYPPSSGIRIILLDIKGGI